MADLRISELAATSGVPASTLRFYESEGILPAERSPNGYRLNGAAAQERLAFIGAARKLQLSLADIRQLLGAWETESCATVKEQLRPAIAAQLDRAVSSITALSTLRDTLNAALARLDQTPDRRSRCDPDCEWLSPPPAAVDVQPTMTVACSLGGAEHAARISAWHSLLAGADTVRIDAGVVVTVPVDRAADLANLIVQEQQCCSFLMFSMSFDGGLLAVQITTGPDAMALLEELLLTPASRGGASA